MVDPDETAATGADTLMGVLDEAAEHGYPIQQIARADGMIECTACSRQSPAADFQIEYVRRLEGASDVADLLLTLWCPCPVCDERGVVTLLYGPNAGDADTAIVEQIDLGGADASPSGPTTP